MSREVPLPTLIKGRRIPIESRRREPRLNPLRGIRRDLVSNAKHGDCILIPHFQLTSYITYILSRKWDYRYESAGWRKLHRKWKRGSDEDEEECKCIYLFFIDPSKDISSNKN